MKLERYASMKETKLQFEDGTTKPYLTSAYMVGYSQILVTPNEFVEYLESTKEGYSVEDKNWVEKYASDITRDGRVIVSACISLNWWHFIKIELKENIDPFDMIQFF